MTPTSRVVKIPLTLHPQVLSTLARETSDLVGPTAAVNMEVRQRQPCGKLLVPTSIKDLVSRRPRRPRWRPYGRQRRQRRRVWRILLGRSFCLRSRLLRQFRQHLVVVLRGVLRPSGRRLHWSGVSKVSVVRTVSSRGWQGQSAFWMRCSCTPSTPRTSSSGGSFRSRGEGTSHPGQPWWLDGERRSLAPWPSLRRAMAT
mmetsp:Transcript_44052/g.116489  ORF Transcript_44052/g.116489 Transcript_44052/m.116489 type:complete len:200 (+) Transcript_44052:234-833(+)